jgi:hypothetical protein
MKNILFYGASVTHQTGKTGYYENLVSNNFNFYRMSYPSSQFYNAGFYNIPRIIELVERPDIVFFEWSTTGENEFNLLKLEYLIRQLSYNQINLVFLLLPKKDTFQIDRKCDIQLHKLSLDFNIPILDLRGLLTAHAPDEIFRDGVHTTEKGAKLYSSCILEFLDSNIVESHDALKFDGRIDFNIKIFDINKVVTESQLLILNFSAASNYSEIAISHSIGPFSPVIEYISDGVVIGSKSIFDTWCYYQRDNFTTLVPQSIISKLTTNSISIKISSVSPDYSITKTGEIFNIEKKLEIKSLYTCDLKDFYYSII